MSECKGGIGGIKCVYIIKYSDSKFENGVFVGLKRKYGKFKREVCKIPYVKPN
jgi:hypothetical protein